MTGKNSSGDYDKNSFGTFGGVFTPAILTILGVIMFMRANFVVGQAGIIGAITILVIAKAITLLTTLSISAISTNMQMRGGGSYFLISRVLGAEFGGAIGIALFFALALSVPFYILGFTEALVVSFSGLVPYFQEISLLMATVLFVVVFFGAGWVIRLQYLIMVLLFLSILAFLGGALLDFNPLIFLANLEPGYTAVGPERDGAEIYSFWVIFAIYFPAVTGIDAGVNMSGDLKDPGHSIPRGTLAAVAVGFAVYLLQMLLCGGAWQRSDLIASPFDLLSSQAIFGWSILVVLGVVAATISSAMGSYLGAPRILQAVSRDRILSFLEPFSIGSRRGDEPRRALLLVFMITIAVLLWAGGKSGGAALNAVASIISMFFLYSYGMINLAAFAVDYAENPSFRPSFKFFHWSTALVGALACTAAAFLINWVAALVAIFIIAALLWFIKTRHLNAAFGDARWGFIYHSIRDNLLRLERLKEDPKNWRPTVIAFSGNPEIRDVLASYSVWIASRHGIVYLANILLGDFEELAPRRAGATLQLGNYCREKNFEAFPVVVTASDLERGVKMLLQGTTIGSIRPNLAVFGWVSEGGEHLSSYLRQIKAAATLGMSVLLLHSGSSFPLLNRYRRIDIWWRGQKNGNLMVLLAHLLMENWEWADAKVRLIRVIENEEGYTPSLEALQELVSMARVEVVPKVIVSRQPFKEVFAEHSADASCVILGFEVPGPDEEAVWHETYGELLNGMPTTILVNSRGEEKLVV